MATTNTVPETYTIKSNGKAIIPKDPNAVLDYPFDWTDYLEDVTDTIASVTWILDPTLLKVDESFTATQAVVWVSGGIAPDPPTANELRVTCRITTAEGRTDDRSIFLKIVER